MTLFLTNREIYSSVICGIVPQVQEWMFKFYANGVCLSGCDGGVAWERRWHENC